MKPLLSFVSVGAVLLVAIAPAVAADTTVDLTPVYNQIIEVATPLIGGALVALIGWLAAILKKKTGIEIDAKHRDTLHSALMTGVTAALTEVGTKLPGTVDVRSIMIARGISWARQAAGDAIQHFGVTDDQLETLAAAKVAQVLGTQGVATPPGG